MHKTQKEHNRDPIQHIHSFIPLVFSILQTLLTGLVSMSHNAMCILGKRHYIVLQYFHKKLSQLGANFQLMSESSDVSQFKNPEKCYFPSSLFSLKFSEQAGSFTGNAIAPISSYEINFR